MAIEQHIYGIPITGVATSTAELDLWDVLAATSYRIEVLELVLAQSADAGDAEAEMKALRFFRGNSAGSGGTATTPRPVRSSSRAALMTATTMQTTGGSGGTVLRSDGWNVQAPYIWRPEKRERILLLPGERLSIRVTAPTDALTLYGTLLVAEIGPYA